MVSFNIKDIVKPSINEIEKYIPGESLSTNSKEKISKLSSNESPFKIPRKVINKVNSLVLSSNLYPDGDCNQLKNQLVKTFNLKFKNIICGNGSDDVLSVIAQTFSKEGSEVICSEFGFTYYPIIARASGCKVVIAKSDKLKISCDNILKSITKLTRIIFIANPNNPTGTIIFKEELLNLLQNVPKNIIVVLDGAYSEFITDRRYTDGIELINKFPNIVVTRTFSKIFALAGLRLGWAYSNEKIIELLEKVRGPFNVNTLSQNVGTLILKEKDFLRKSIIHNDKWRKIKCPKTNKVAFRETDTLDTFVDSSWYYLRFCSPKNSNYGYDIDEIVMVHTFIFKTDKNLKKLTSFLKIEGEDKTYTAMSKTVGLQIAVLVEHIINVNFNLL